MVGILSIRAARLRFPADFRPAHRHKSRCASRDQMERGLELEQQTGYIGPHRSAKSQVGMLHHRAIRRVQTQHDIHTNTSHQITSHHARFCEDDTNAEVSTWR